MRKFLLSGDPGVANFGLVLWDLESGKCLLATKLQHAISDLTAEFQPQLDSFLAEVQKHLDSVGYNSEDDYLVVALERFIARGMRTSSTPELIPLMMGVLVTLADESHLYIAATWKGYVNRALKPLKATLQITAKNKDAMLKHDIRLSIYKKYGRRLGTGGHIIDAALIGKHYMALNGFNRLTTIADFRNLFKEVQGALCLPAKKR